MRKRGRGQAEHEESGDSESQFHFFSARAAIIVRRVAVNGVDMFC